MLNILPFRCSKIHVIVPCMRNLMSKPQSLFKQSISIARPLLYLSTIINYHLFTILYNPYRHTGDRQPCVSDQANMAYTQAFILEVLRHSTVLPLGIPHMAADNTKLEGYHIPKGAIVSKYNK